MDRTAFISEETGINEQASKNIREKHTLSATSMKTLASSSDNARIFECSSFDDKTDRNDFANSSDSGLSCGRGCSLDDTSFENPVSHRHQVATR